MKKKIIFLSLAILATLFIFANSLKDGTKSSSQSNVITNVVVEVAEGITSKPQNYNLWSLFVRKTGHFSEFAIAGLLWALAMLSFWPKKWSLAIGLGITAIIAFTDEFIQSFVDGRVASIFDSFIDISGASLSILILFFILLIRNRRKKENSPVFTKEEE